MTAGFLSQVKLPSWLALPTLADLTFGAVLVFFVYRAVRTGVREGFQRGLGKAVDRKKLNTALDLFLARMGSSPVETPRGQIPPAIPEDGAVAKRIREALSLAAEGSSTEGRKILEELKKKHPKDVHVLWALADMYLREKRYKDAAEILEEAVQVDATDGILHHNLGVARFRLEQYEEALKAFREAITKGTGKAAPYLFAGYCLWRLGRLDEAIGLTRDGLTIAMHSADAATQARGMNNLAYYIFDAANRRAREAGKAAPEPDVSLEEAQRLHEGAVERRGMTPGDLDTRGCLKIWGGDLEGALADVELAIKQGGPNPTRVEHYLRITTLMTARQAKKTP